MKKIKYGAAMMLVLACCAGCGMNAQTENTDLGMAAVENLEYKESLNYFTDAVSAGEDLRSVYRGMGIAYMGLTDYESAVFCLEAALQAGNGTPQDIDFDINYYLAIAYYRNGQPEEAIERYDAILALRPKDRDAYYLRGCVYLYTGDYEQAMADFTQAISLDTSDFDCVIQIAQMLAEAGYESSGQMLLEQALSGSAKTISDYDLGRIYYYLGDYNAAKTYLSGIKTASDAEATLYLGRTYEALGDYNYASELYADYVATDSSNAEIYNQLGLCRLQLGEYDLALQSFQAGMAVADSSLMQALKFNEIVAYEYMEEYTTAATLMSSYLQSYPDDATAKREYQFLSTR